MMRKLLAVTMGVISLAGFANEVPVVMQSGLDGSVIEEREVETGTAITTVAAPSAAGYIFTGWTSSDTSAFSARDRLGRALESARLTVYGETRLTANYVAEDVDCDSDGIPDGYELYWYGTLTYASTSDTDGDGYTFAEEIAAGTNPLMADRGAVGGIARDEGEMVQYNPQGLPSYTIRSEPEGRLFETICEFVKPGSVVTTSSHGTDTTFAYWTLDGKRVADRHGRAKDCVTFTMGNAPVEVVAVCEDDADLREKLYWYGTLTYASTSDTDGDGYTFAEEIAAGTNPLMADRGAVGGIARDDGEMVQYNPFGLQQYVIRSEPEGALFESVTNIVKAGTEVTTESYATDSGFAYWTLDGKRVADRHGRAKDCVTFTMGNAPVEVVAVCEDDADLREKLYWYGTLTYASTSDTDGDGYTFAEEIAAGTNPLMADRGAVGGIARDDGDEINVNFQLYEQLQGALIDGNYREVFFSPYGGNAATSRTFADGAQIWPVVADVNGDGLWDMIVVSETATNVFVNVGSRGNPQFAESGCYGTTIPQTVDLEMNSTAKLAEMTFDVAPAGALSATTHDATMLVSDGEGRIWLYERAAEGVYRLRHKVWGGSFAGFARGLMLATVDWEDDGDLDCLCGTADGKLMLLRDPKIGRPTNLSAVGGADSVVLTWDPNVQSRVRGYKVYRADGGSEDFGVRGAPALPTWRDTGLAVGLYDYRVTSVSRFYRAGSSTPMVSESPATEPVRVELGKVTLRINEASGFVGREAEVTVSVDNSLNLSGAGLEIAVAYDATALTPQEIKTSALTENLNLSQEVGTGTWKVRGTGGEIAPGTGNLLTFVFRVAEGADEGDTNVEITTAALKSTANGDVTVPMPIRGVVSLEAYDPPDPSCVPFYGRGDLDGDGRLGWNDIELMLKWKDSRVQDLSAEAIRAGDYNGDGVLDNRDYPLMRRDFRTREAQGGDMVGWDKNHATGGGSK